MRVLLIIDMLKDFMEKEGPLYCGDNSRKIIPFIKKKIDECRGPDCKVIYSCDAHAPDDREFSMFSPHAVKGSEGAKVIEELEPAPGDIVVEKTTVIPFYGTDLERLFVELNPEEVDVVGVCTSICVMEAVADLSVRGYRTVVFKDGIADFDKEAHDFALKRMESVYGAEIK
ncbi:MAG: isochorismatase family cysteine hydrolase [Candidatus Omnitrophota bacterium]|nr:isochorismatase family cysteine hydrolase [Candidatus Omnitrophota bacterium]